MDGLQITPASFIDAMKLQQDIARALKGSPIDIDMDVTLDSIGNQEIGNSTLETIIKAVLSLVTSDTVLDSLFKCAEKALYQKEKVDRDFFEAVENRELFYPIMIEIAKVNISPFFKNLSGMLSGFTQTAKSNQKQK